MSCAHRAGLQVLHQANILLAASCTVAVDAEIWLVREERDHLSQALRKAVTTGGKPRGSANRVQQRGKSHQDPGAQAQQLGADHCHLGRLLPGNARPPSGRFPLNWLLQRFIRFYVLVST